MQAPLAGINSYPHDMGVPIGGFPRPVAVGPVGCLQATLSGAITPPNELSESKTGGISVEAHRAYRSRP